MNGMNKAALTHGHSLTRPLIEEILVTPLLRAIAECDGDAAVQHVWTHSEWIDVPDQFGRTPLILAAIMGQESVVEVLLFFHADLAAKDGTGRTALMHCAWQGHVQIGTMLLAKKFSLEEQDHEGRTALMFAVWNNKLPMVKYLVAQGASLETTDHSSSNVALIAQRFGNHEVAGYIESVRKPRAQESLLQRLSA